MRSRRQDIYTEPDANGGELRTRNFPTRQHVHCQEGLKINVQAVRFRFTVENSNAKHEVDLAITLWR